MRRSFLASVLAGAGALAATTGGCRKREPAASLPHAAAPAPSCLLIDGPQRPVGFDAAFSLTARLGCPDLTGGRVAWQQIEGPPVRALTTAQDGFALTARTPSIVDALGGRIPWGVVPLSPRTRGEIVLRATWSGDGGQTHARDVHVVAADRSRGLPNTPVGVRVYLGGRGWQILTRPAESRAALEGKDEVKDDVTSLLPDVPGDWRLKDGAGRTLALRAGRYDETPLDCGRSGCHPAITDAVARSPMTTVLARLMNHRLAPAYPRCALACHATGEPGAHDGGFAHVASEIGTTAVDLGSSSWEALPRDLHRLGGVGCLACHGPGAIPEASARWAVLRADVCATCHDAPPRYGHLVAWRQTAMSRADQDPRARTEAACIGCHTTSGFLSRVAAPEPQAGRQPVDRRAPDDAGPFGITCSACHAVHDPKRPEGTPRLVRVTPTPALLAGVASSVCLPCHTPAPDDDSPSASAAALLFGRGGLDPASGEPLVGSAPHAAVMGGCVGCHRDGPENVQHGAGHAFRASARVCTSCHPPREPASDLRARAEQLWRTLQLGEPQGPPHASSRSKARVDRSTARGRAIWDLLLVLEDRAAEAHNLPYAKALLTAASKVLE